MVGQVMSLPSAYLDTCVISGIARQDLKTVELEALSKILELYQQSKIRLVTSDVARGEIDKIPEQFRYTHKAVYLLLSTLPISSITRPNMMMLLGVGGGGHDPI